MDFNEGILPLERKRSSDDFADALEISRLCALQKPFLVVPEQEEFTFESGLNAVHGVGAVAVTSGHGSLDVRTLIATLTTQDAGAVANVQTSSISELEKLRQSIWHQSSLRGDYQVLLESAPPHVSGLVGLFIGAAQANVCTVIEGVDAFAAALLAQRIAYRSTERLLVAQLPQDPAEQEAQRRLRLPVVLATKVPKSAALVALNHLETTLSLTN